MTLKIFQKGFNFSQDGPGNRLVYHMQGCNLHCPWCANPESIPMEPYPCFSANLIAYSLDDIKQEILSSKMMFFENGGVTFTGGEPTLQFEALSELLSWLKEEKINTAIETNGTHKNLYKLAGKIDHFMIDFKHPDEKIHKKITGIGNQMIKENIKWLVENHPSVIIRIPFINGYNTDEKALKGFIEFFETLNNPKPSVELLIYHEYGKHKWEQCGKEYSVKNGHVEADTVRQIRDTFINIGVQLIET